MEHTQTLLYLILIIAAAKIGGEIAEYLKQPAVLGELLAGMLLGLTSFRVAVTDPAIVFVASIGIILLLLEVGLESELSELAQVGRSAALVAMIGIVLPLAAGFATVYAFQGNYQQALFIGAVLTATSIGITTRVLSDLGKMNSSEAKIILGAAVIDDILGLLILAVVLQIVKTGSADAVALTKSLLISMAFLVGAIWAGIRFAPKLIALAQRLKTRGVLVSIAFLFCLTLAYGAESLGLAEIIGAFAAGLVLATTDDRVRIHDKIKPLTDVFVPVFFVLVGMQVDLRDLLGSGPEHNSIMIMSAILMVLAVITKLVAGLGVLTPQTNKLAVGVGMLPRGEVALIFASMGLRENVIAGSLYAGLVLVVFVTTFIAPVWLRRIFSRQAR